MLVRHVRECGCPVVGCHGRRLRRSEPPSRLGAPDRRRWTSSPGTGRSGSLELRWRSRSSSRVTTSGAAAKGVDGHVCRDCRERDRDANERRDGRRRSGEDSGHVRLFAGTGHDYGGGVGHESHAPRLSRRPARSTITAACSSRSRRRRSRPARCRPGVSGTGICLGGGATGAEYALVAFHANTG